MVLLKLKQNVKTNQETVISIPLPYHVSIKLMLMILGVKWSQYPCQSKFCICKAVPCYINQGANSNCLREGNQNHNPINIRDIT